MAKQKDIIVGQIPIDLLSKKKQKTIFSLIKEIEKKKTMGEILDLIKFARKCNLKESKKEPNVFFIGKTRISFVIDFFLNKNPVRILRTESIYKDSNIPHINLNNFDAVIASRMLVPIDGMLFKLTEFRDKTEYSDLAVSIEANKEILAFEKNVKTGELSLMILCRNNVYSDDQEFLNRIKASENAIYGHFNVGGGESHKISDWF